MPRTRRRGRLTHYEAAIGSPTAYLLSGRSTALAVGAREHLGKGGPEPVHSHRARHRLLPLSETAGRYLGDPSFRDRIGPRCHRRERGEQGCSLSSIGFSVQGCEHVQSIGKSSVNPRLVTCGVLHNLSFYHRERESRSASFPLLAPSHSRASLRFRKMRKGRSDWAYTSRSSTTASAASEFTTTATGYAPHP